MNRRGFLGVLAGLPIAAALVPKVSVPEVAAAPSVEAYARDYFARGLMTPSEVRCKEGLPGELTVTIHCDTTEFRRELAKAHGDLGILQRALNRGVRVERA